MSTRQKIRRVDAELLRFVGLASDPQGQTRVNRLLDERLELMQDRDRGFSLNDRRRIRF